MNFQSINQYGNIIDNNELFTQYHDSQMPIKYDSNYISFREVPTLAEFIEVETYLKRYHQGFNQNHLKFTIPGEKTLPKELESYLTNLEYSIGTLEMYKVNPSNFKGNRSDNTNIQYVTEYNWELFAQMQFNEDLRFGQGFAMAKQPFLKRVAQLSKWRAIMVYDEENQPVGSLELIISEDTVEIDNLFIVEHKQKQGYGTQLQAFVMNAFPTKTVILVADGDDTPKEMYKRQGYEFVDRVFEILKVGF